MSNQVAPQEREQPNGDIDPADTQAAAESHRFQAEAYQCGGLVLILRLRMSFDPDRFMAVTFGHATSDWEATRDWVARRLHRVAHDKTTITYSDLCREMARAGVLPLEPHSPALARLLGQVNLLEHEARRPLISALVVHKAGDWQPGEGFWSFARDVGIDTGSTEDSRLEFWVREVERCQAYWAGQS